jgi:hypothetical protein
MSIYKVADKVSGLTVKLTGNTPPTEGELEGIFNELKQSDEKKLPDESFGDNLKKEGGTIMAGKNVVIGTVKAVPLLLGGAKAVPFLLGGAVAAGVTFLVASKSRKPRPGPVKRLTSGARDQASATFNKLKSAVKR